MGYAHGQLMAEEARVMVARTWAYFESQAADALAGLPTWLAQDIIDFGLSVALDATYELTKNYTGEYFFEELQGEWLCVRLRLASPLLASPRWLGLRHNSRRSAVTRVTYPIH